MAILAPEIKKLWNLSLSNCQSPWIFFGLDADKLPLSEKMQGMSGLIDWTLHGQVSKLLAKGKMSGEFSLFPSNSSNKPNFLLYHYAHSPDLKKVNLRLASLKIQKMAIAESTFPQDFCRNLKQNLEKEDIQWTTLEPNPK